MLSRAAGVKFPDCKSHDATPLLKALQQLLALLRPKVNAWTGLERPSMTWPQLLLFSLSLQSYLSNLMGSTLPA